LIHFFSTWKPILVLFKELFFSRLSFQLHFVKYRSRMRETVDHMGNWWTSRWHFEFRQRIEPMNWEYNKMVSALRVQFYGAPFGTMAR
jgi:hypothetical protein